jgi:ribosomal protein S18 acetylase RimI-like enzyme
MSGPDTAGSAAEPHTTPSISVVRRAGAPDAAGLSELASATFALACPPETSQSAIDDFIATHFTEEHFAGYLADPDRALFLAEVDGRAAGYTMLVFEEPSDPDVSSVVAARPTVELSKIYVLPGFHGAGVAQSLIEASVVSAAESGARSIWLGVNQHNARANRFYEKSGFVRVGIKKFLVGEKYEDDFVRERCL